ncbi:MAG: hypothetical protein KDD67_12520 [Ignavibacteriae bacterium]|nr:hypothetical protein [Ignavibacteriota bacterium]MCB9214298.1 hypothetical protein [Ignavibacteria bacterium]
MMWSLRLAHPVDGKDYSDALRKIPFNNGSVFLELHTGRESFCFPDITE